MFCGCGRHHACCSTRWPDWDPQAQNRTSSTTHGIPCVCGFTTESWKRWRRRHLGVQACGTVLLVFTEIHQMDVLAIELICFLADKRGGASRTELRSSTFSPPSFQSPVSFDAWKKEPWLTKQADESISSGLADAS